jgi:3-deoxy-D-manno-octulosonic-acid transferase
VRDARYLGSVPERFGFLPALYRRTISDSIWLHAVSVGEVLSSVALITRLKSELPGSPVFVSCSTLAGREAAHSRLGGIVDGIFYAPFDYVFCVRRVLRAIRPAIVIVLETEIWPNLYRESKRSDAALVIVNGRISSKTAETYARFRWFFSTVLGLADAMLVQSDGDRNNYVRAGAPPHLVTTAGNLKYDFDPVGSVPFLDHGPPLWIAASTVAPEYRGDIDEDDVVISAYRELITAHPNLRLLIAPRKPERFSVVADKLSRAGIEWERRSALTGDPVPVILLDTVGELAATFSAADVVFMGGTLADRGGHNILEPALFSRPIIVGPHLENFREIERQFEAAGAFVRIENPHGLAGAVDRLLLDPGLRSDLGERARQTAERQRGATSRAVSAIVGLRSRVVPRTVPHLALHVLAALWRAGGRWKRAHAQTRALSVPVISVGGIAMGGVGKTPFVAYLSAELDARGYKCAVLTRGYKRQTSESATILPAGTSAPVSRTGDEAQILLRRAVAALGIGADRYAAGRQLEEQIKPDVFLLDDGFQHAGLRRDIDIVLLDGLDPFAGGYVFPAGGLREPVESLSRADVIVITRAAGRQLDGVIARIRELNTQAPVYSSTVQPIAWHEHDTERSLPAGAFAGRTVTAFCGIGNPAAFWQTLEELECIVSERHAFPDHHRYTESDLRGMSGLIVTTEKDAVNLPRTGVPNLYWLEIGVAVDRPAELMGSLLLPVTARQT